MDLGSGFWLSVVLLGCFWPVLLVIHRPSYPRGSELQVFSDLRVGLSLRLQFSGFNTGQDMISKQQGKTVAQKSKCLRA